MLYNNSGNIKRAFELESGPRYIIILYVCTAKDGRDGIMRTLYPVWEFQWGKAEGLFACILHMNLNAMSYNDTLTYNVSSL